MLYLSPDTNYPSVPYGNSILQVLLSWIPEDPSVSVIGHLAKRVVDLALCSANSPYSLTGIIYHVNGLRDKNRSGTYSHTLSRHHTQSHFFSSCSDICVIFRSALLDQHFYEFSFARVQWASNDSIFTDTLCWQCPLETVGMNFITTKCI